MGESDKTNKLLALDVISERAGHFWDIEMIKSQKKGKKQWHFYGCTAYGGPNSCTFFEWFDPKPPKRFADVIQNLLEANESLSNDNHNMMKMNSELRMALRETTKKADELADDVDGMVAANVVLGEDLTTCVISQRRLRSALVAVLSVLIACVLLRVVNNWVVPVGSV
ncbi:hypothetical protein PIB30_056682 [Stylosanthes scabra]|uniref:Zinc finger GRF-type domain-containing protein n=1 Tax=Stylosanthes scabra TaxID=79078 RepID=A0ABU6YGW5_9FABA|nr:hypothetical protein [Stylosanthes scabra]